MARNKELNEKMKEVRKEEILSNALQIFSEKGLSATKITDIAARTGFSQGLIYHYYKSKEEIFAELIDTAFKKLNDACRYLENLDVPPIEKIKMTIEGMVSSLNKNEDSAKYHVLIAQAAMLESTPEQAKKIISKENKIPYKIMAKIIKSGQENGSIKSFDPDELSMVLWNSIKGLALHKASLGKKFKAPDIEILMSMFYK